jgi:hypothetical protein
MSNSSSCIQNDHASCDGIIKTIIDGSEITEMCALALTYDIFQLATIVLIEEKLDSHECVAIGSSPSIAAAHLDTQMQLRESYC